MLRSFIIFLTTLAVAAVIIAVSVAPEASVPEHAVYTPPPERLPLLVKTSALSEAPGASGPKALPSNVLHQVPFTSQAPLTQWGDPRFQDACEEASIYMAVLWLQGDERVTVNAETATEDLLDLSKLSEDLFDTFVDTSAEDTLWLLKNEVPSVTARVIENPTVEDMKRVLAEGGLVITPLDGQVLINPYFTGPGPERHMVTVIGYDDETQEFIVNDPGTQRGAGFRYNYENFFIALRDYPTGDVLPIETLEKRAIIVHKSPSPAAAGSDPDGLPPSDAL